MRLGRCGAVALACVAFGSPALAHPHAWIETRSDVVFDGQGKIAAINVEWDFDPNYSEMAVDGLDENGDGYHSAGELMPLARENLIALKDYDYFIKARAGADAVGYGDVSKYEIDGEIRGQGSVLKRLVACEYFRIDRVQADTGYTQMLEYDQPVIWMALSGGGMITTSNTPPIRFQQGQTMLLPPAMLDAKLTTACDTTWLEVTFPQAAPTRMA